MFLNSLEDFERGKLFILGECIEVDNDIGCIKMRLAKGIIRVIPQNIQHFELHRFYGIIGDLEDKYLIEKNLFETCPDIDFDLCVDMVESFSEQLNQE